MHTKTQTRQRTIVWLMILMLAIPGLALAMRKGRLIGKVLDPDGNPIEEVTVVATSEYDSTFREVMTTNHKGIFKVDFEEINVIYHLRFEKAGYISFESEQDWKLEGTARDEFVMYPGEEAAVEGVPLASTSNEAINAYNEGVIAYNSKDYVTAKVKFQEALEHDPELHQAWAALAKISLHQDKADEAVAATEKAVALGATDEEVWRTRWQAYRELGDEAKAEEALKDLERAGLRAEEAKRVHNEAVALADAGDDEAAFKRFQEALKIDPNLQAALLGVGTTGIKTGHNEEAADAAEAILNTEPGNEQAIRIRYNACLELGDKDRLVDALMGLASVEPEVARDSLLQLAFDAYYDASDPELAKSRFEKVLTVDNNQPHAHYYLGLIFVREGESKKAQEHLERFVEIAPDDPEAANAAEILSYLRDS